MANQTQIANLALSWLGQQQINNLNDNQTEAKIMKQNYDLSRDMLLGSRAWTFALRREILSPDGTQPAFGGQNRFLIPSDVLRVFRCYRPSTTSTGSSAADTFLTGGATNLPPARWVREGRYIISPVDTIWALFIYRNTNTDMYPPEFNHALAARLAADTCLTFTENRQRQIDMETLFQEKLAAAAYSDGSQGRTEVLNSNILTGARSR